MKNMIMGGEIARADVESAEAGPPVGRRESLESRDPAKSIYADAVSSRPKASRKKNEISIDDHPHIGDVSDGRKLAMPDSPLSDAKSVSRTIDAIDETTGRRPIAPTFQIDHNRQTKAEEQIRKHSDATQGQSDSRMAEFESRVAETQNATRSTAGRR